MNYNLEFKEEALKEWKRLDPTLQKQFKKKLKKILENPEIPSARLSGFGVHNCYKIKLRQSGYRLVYEVVNDILTVIVIGVGKRDRNQAYLKASRRFED